MFFVEFASGLHYESLALTGDSLDMLGDAIAYGSSLFVVGGTILAKARASQLKAYLMVLLGVVVAGRAIYRVFFEAFPNTTVMGFIGLLALTANLICLALLTRHKADDINFSSVWICSRNDIIANVSVLVAAWLVVATGNRWPDLVVGLGIAVLFTKSAFFVLSEARKSLKLI